MNTCAECEKAIPNGKKLCLPCAKNIYHEVTRLSKPMRKAEYIRKKREQAIAAYGGACVCCGETTREFLTFDHIYNGRGNPLKNRKVGIAWYCYLVKHRPKDVQLLCFNCNMAKAHYGRCPHYK